MLYKLDFTVEYDETMAQQGLLGIWAEEANAALGAKSARGIGSKTAKSCEFAELVLLRLAGMAGFPAAWQRG